jgi:hypothetical protein
MALVMMALLFLLKERQLPSEELALLSAADVKFLLARLLARRDLDLEESIRQAQVRHRQRQGAIDSVVEDGRRLQDAPSRNLTK